MTGPEHYREAERILLTNPHQAHLAQAHATLALAAATAMSNWSPDGGMLNDDRQAWLRACSEQPTAEAARREARAAEQREFEAET